VDDDTTGIIAFAGHHSDFLSVNGVQFADIDMARAFFDQQRKKTKDARVIVKSVAFGVPYNVAIIHGTHEDSDHEPGLILDMAAEPIRIGQRPAVPLDATLMGSDVIVACPPHSGKAIDNILCVVPREGQVELRPYIASFLRRITQNRTFGYAAYPVAATIHEAAMMLAGPNKSEAAPLSRAIHMYAKRAWTRIARQVLFDIAGDTRNGMPVLVKMYKDLVVDTDQLSCTMSMDQRFAVIMRLIALAGLSIEASMK
jgi:hypothetical protein